jgi:hypothetical protein
VPPRDVSEGEQAQHVGGATRFRRASVAVLLGLGALVSIGSVAPDSVFAEDADQPASERVLAPQACLKVQASALGPAEWSDVPQVVVALVERETDYFRRPSIGSDQRAPSAAEQASLVARIRYRGDTQEGP